MWRPGALQPDHHQWTGKSQRLERWQVAVQLTPCRDRLSGPALAGYADRQARATSPAAHLLEPPVMLSRISLQPSVKLTWTYASQTGGLVHAKAGQVSQ